MSVNYDRVCRLCLSSRGELLPIFPTTSSDDSEPPVLVSKIKDCVSVQISENDDLPTNVCRKCVNNVHNWHIFKSVCERTQNKLKTLIKKDGSQLEEVNIKNEPLYDELYDDGVVIDGSYPENGTSSKVQPEGPPILASLGLTPRSDKKYVDPRMDWPRVHAILDIIQEDEAINSLQKTEESDFTQHSDHDSDTDIELTSDIEIDEKDTSQGYMCRNGVMLSKEPYKTKLASKPQRGKRKPLVPCCPEPRNAWELLFTDQLLDLIVTATNTKINRNGALSSSTNINEIRALIGILYIHGVMRPINQKASDLWHSKFGVSCVQRAMSYERFKFLLENLNLEIENDDQSEDPMRHMREVFDMFAKNCTSSYEIGENAVIDETIVPVFGPCSFRYEIDKKALIKNGIKMLLLVDPDNFYISNLEVVTGYSSNSEQIVTKLVQHLAGSNKTIMIDSWFSSMQLIRKLKTEYQLYSIAALNMKHELLIPPIFIAKDRKIKTMETGFVDQDITLASYVNVDSKAVNIMTNSPLYYKKQSYFRLGSVVWQYKKDHSAVEVVDILMHYYTTMQNCNDWTLSIFYTMLNIASINAQVIWASQTKNEVFKRRLFIRELGGSLLDSKVAESCPVKKMKATK